MTSETAPKASSSKEETKQKQSPPPEEYEPSDSALTVMVVALFSLFFKLSWLVTKPILNSSGVSVVDFVNAAAMIVF